MSMGASGVAVDHALPPQRDHRAGRVLGDAGLEIEGGGDEPAVALRVPGTDPGVDEGAHAALALKEREQGSEVEGPGAADAVGGDEAREFQLGGGAAVGGVFEEREGGDAVPGVAAVRGAGEGEGEGGAGVAPDDRVGEARGGVDRAAVVAAREVHVGAVEERDGGGFGGREHVHRGGVGDGDRVRDRGVERGRGGGRRAGASQREARREGEGAGEGHRRQGVTFAARVGGGAAHSTTLRETRTTRVLDGRDGCGSGTSRGLRGSLTDAARDKHARFPMNQDRPLLMRQSPR
jgi:hypothetical protein